METTPERKQPFGSLVLSGSNIHGLVPHSNQCNKASSGDLVFSTLPQALAYMDSYFPAEAQALVSQVRTLCVT
jgi:hypothetical protein